MRIIRYDYSFLIKPVAALSVLSIVFYLLKLFGLKPDMVYIIISAAVVLAFMMICVKSKPLKFCWFVLIAGFVSIYFIIIRKNILSIAAYLPNNLYFFSLVNAILNTFGIYDYEQLMFNSSLGGAKLINGELVCGFVNLAKYGSESAALFLTEKAVFVFALIGILISFALVDKEFRIEYLIIALSLLLTGNVTPVLLLLLITKRPIYYLTLLFSFLSCVVAQLADRSFTFLVSPSVFELFLHSSARTYLFAEMIFIISAAYLITRLVCEKVK